MKNHQKIKHLLFYICLLFSTFLLGQNNDTSYIEIHDSHSFDVRFRYQDSLNAAAQRLASVFAGSPTIQSQFKVLSGNFYRHNGSMKDGIPAAMGMLQSLANQESPYYLLIGKESNDLGTYQRFWVDLKLPQETVNSCFDGARKSMVTEMAEQEMNKIHEQNDKRSYKFAEAEKAGMAVVQGFLKKFIDCCLPLGARSSITCACEGIDTITTHLVKKRGMLYFDVDDLTATDFEYPTIDANKNILVTNNGFPWALTDELVILASGMSAAKDSIKVRYFDETSCFFIWDYLNGKDDLPTATLRNNNTSDFFHEVIVLKKKG